MSVEPLALDRVSERASRLEAGRPPRIDRLPDRVGRPFWSVMIPVYNCSAAYLREALASVLVQDPGEADMQIEVIDNCSTRIDVQPLVEEIGGGRISFHRQPYNVGMAGNFNTCIRRARGHWVHILHDDDAVRPGFYASARKGIEQHEDVGAALCRQIFIDENGNRLYESETEARAPGVLDAAFVGRLLLESRVQFPSMVVRRSTYEELGGFRPDLQACLDWDMWKRIALRKSIFYSPELLACFRIHGGADGTQLTLIGENVADERRSIDITCTADLPPEQASSIQHAARKASGIRAARRARLLWTGNNATAAWIQAAEALRCSLAPAVLLRLAYFMVRTVVPRRKLHQGLEEAR